MIETIMTWQAELTLRLSKLIAEGYQPIWNTHGIAWSGSGFWAIHHITIEKTPIPELKREVQVIVAEGQIIDQQINEAIGRGFTPIWESFTSGTIRGILMSSVILVKG